VKRATDWFLIIAALALFLGGVASLFLWDWRYIAGGVIGAVCSAIAKAAVEGPDRR
jgi:hypothetical protein